MTKKEYCETYPIWGVWPDSAFTGIEVHGIERDSCEDYVYYIRILGNKRTYHKSKIRYYDNRPYFSWKDVDIFLNEILKV